MEQHPNQISYLAILLLNALIATILFVFAALR
jgi:hypothetical protein